MAALKYGWAGLKRETGELQFHALQGPPGGGPGPKGRNWQKLNMLRAMESALKWDKELIVKVRLRSPVD